MTTETLAPLAPPPTPETIEAVLLGGDLGRLTPAERLSYYSSVCRSLGLNPLTKPLEYITLEGKLRLYMRKDGTEQLRRIHGVSIVDLTSTQVGDVFVVTAKASNRDGRTDVATGAVAIGTLRGGALGDALMKAETKAKRRVTLSICGLGVLDESEVREIPGAVPHDVDLETGEMREAPAAKITDAQRRRLFALARKHGWTTAQLKAWLYSTYRLESTKDLASTDYDAVCADLEREATKPAPPDVETPF
jgi:hypothetical protein